MNRSDVAPPGREKQVLALKKKPGIDNPFAVAWASKNKKKEHKDMDKHDAEAHLKRAMGTETDDDESLSAAEHPESMEEDDDEMDSIEALLGVDKEHKGAVHEAAKKGEHGHHAAHEHGSMTHGEDAARK